MNSATNSFDIERWRLKTHQDQDDDFAPMICLLEEGEPALWKKYDRRTAMLTCRDQTRFEIVNGLFARKVRKKSGEGGLVPVIPRGRVRCIIAQRKRREIEWRPWLLHILHNTTAGGHVGMPALEQRVLKCVWWPNLHVDCENWCRKCIACRASKGVAAGSSTWRSDRYTSPFRVLLTWWDHWNPHPESF